MVRGLLKAPTVSNRIQQLVFVAALLCTFSVSAESQAEPHARDGFYVQLTTGFGLPRRSVTAEDGVPGSLDHYAASEKGFSTSGSLLLGVPLRPGIVLGLGGDFTLILTGAPQLTKNGQAYGQVDVKPPFLPSMSMIGPFVDIYPIPTLGWHVQALVGYGQVTYAQITEHPYGDGDPTGIGLILGVGDDWWVSEHWSIGLLARLTYANMQLTDYTDGVLSTTEHDTIVSPSLDISFTSH